MSWGSSTMTKCSRVMWATRSSALEGTENDLGQRRHLVVVSRPMGLPLDSGRVRGMVMEADWDLVHSGKFSSLK